MNSKPTRRSNGWGLVKQFAVVCSLLCVPSNPARADEPVYRRWAIVATPAVQQTGLPDLLTAELSQLRHIELVERDQIVEATRELEIDAVLGSDSTTGRLKLGICSRRMP
jgi:hypothetical protein